MIKIMFEELPTPEFHSLPGGLLPSNAVVTNRLTYCPAKRFIAYDRTAGGSWMSPGQTNTPPMHCSLLDIWYCVLMYLPMASLLYQYMFMLPSLPGKLPLASTE